MIQQFLLKSVPMFLMLCFLLHFLLVIISTHACSMEPIVFDNYGFECLIGKLRISSSCGVDNVNSKFLANTKVYCSIISTKLFAQSLETSCIPDEWKVGKVVPLHKSGDRHSPNNYRPVSLTSLRCKTMEHVIYSHIVNFLEIYNALQIHFSLSFNMGSENR